MNKFTIIAALIILQCLAGCANKRNTTPDSHVYKRVIEMHHKSYKQDNDYYYRKPKPPVFRYIPRPRRRIYPSDYDSNYKLPRRNYPQDNDHSYTRPKKYYPYPQDNDNVYYYPGGRYAAPSHKRNNFPQDNDADMNYIYPLYLD